jgi:histidinol-phosphate aminotransferase
MGRGFLKPALAGHRPYTPGEQPAATAGWIKLNTNEAPLGPSNRVLDAIRGAATEDLRLYPRPDAGLARAAIAAGLGVDPEWVTVGNGADGVLELCFRAFAGAGEPVAFLSPSYPLFEVLCGVHENEAHAHRLDPGWRIPEAYFEDPARLRFLVNPDSPTGAFRDGRLVRRAAESAPGVLVLDEAYVDFAPEHRLDLAREMENVVVVRTFSKSSALAGMRVGFAVANPELIGALDLVKDSYSVDRLAEAAAAAAIADVEHRDRIVEVVTAGRAYLARFLAGLGFEVSPSAANFLLVRPRPPIDAPTLAEELRRRRILVRRYTNPPLADWVRITIGAPTEMAELEAAVGEVFAAAGAAP